MSQKATTATACDHPAEGEALHPHEVQQAFGVTATAMIPFAPGFVKLKNDSGAPVYLSRLECQHIIMLSPTTVAAAEKKAGHPLLDIQESKKGDRIQAAKARYEDLLARTRAGEEIAAADVVAAKEAIALEELAEEGRQERAEAARLVEEAKARTALELPALDELGESRERLQRLQKQAYETVMALLEAVDEDMALQDEVATRLIAAGFDSREVRPPARGFSRATVVAGQAFPYWHKMEWLIGVLTAVRHGKHGRHRNAFIGLEGRSLDSIPTRVQGGPVPEP